MIRRKDWSFLTLASTFCFKQNEGNAQENEGNLLCRFMGPDARTFILVSDGSVGKQIGFFEVLL